MASPYHAPAGSARLGRGAPARLAEPRPPSHNRPQTLWEDRSMAEGKSERYHRIAVEEAYMIPEIAALESTRVPGRSETSKLRAYIMKSLLDLGDDRIKAMDEDGIAMQVCLLAGIGLQ